MDDHKQLFQRQMVAWPMAAGNYQALKSILSKDVILDGLRIRLQCNPARLVSSAANVSASAIQKRPCFLCAGNRPAEQESLKVTSSADFELLINPFPVFPTHYTIPAIQHQPQQIHGHIAEFLRFSHDMNDCVVFYNGPRCGASAPDHLHFQAGSKGLMPAETDFRTWKETRTTPLVRLDGGRISQLNGFLRAGWLLEGTSERTLARLVENVINVLAMTQATADEEPMINLLSWMENEEWKMLLFPRKAHRPTCYFNTGDTRFLISPASVEMGGLMVAARLQDFERMTETDIRQIYADVSLSDDVVNAYSTLLLTKPDMQPSF